MPVDEAKIDNLLELVWQTAARLNPMMLTKLRADFDFDRLRDMIRDCLEKGLSETATCEHTVRELLRSARTDSQPRDTCDHAIEEGLSSV
jgi:hypothetical protein